MNHIKKLLMTAFAVTALVAVPGTASATIFESTSGPLGKGIKMEMTGTNVVLKAGFATVECAHSELDGEVTSAGGASATTYVSVSNWKVTQCNMTVTTIRTGSKVFHFQFGWNGGWTSSGWETRVDNHSTSCVYGTPTETNLGTLTGGEPATLKGSATLPKISGGFLCASTASWTASYTVTSPTSLFVTAS
jgi:hypothetical protein